jgi:hypothetical protein
MTTYAPKKVDWRKSAATDPDPDDMELAQTPPDVIAILGFDPKEESDVLTSHASVSGAASAGPASGLEAINSKDHSHV